MKRNLALDIRGTGSCRVLNRHKTNKCTREKKSFANQPSSQMDRRVHDTSLLCFRNDCNAHPPSTMNVHASKGDGPVRHCQRTRQSAAAAIHRDCWEWKRLANATVNTGPRLDTTRPDWAAPWAGPSWPRGLDGRDHCRGTSSRQTRAARERT